MAHSLETGALFVDNDLVDFAMKLPVKYKLGNLTKVIELNENRLGPKKKIDFQKTQDGKLMLRKAMAPYSPKKTTEKHDPILIMKKHYLNISIIQKKEFVMFLWNY